MSLEKNILSNKKTISFCVSCRNRLWQLEKTLAGNIASLDDDLEISLVDYGSTDGLSDFIWSNFKHYIDSGKLVFFEVKNQVSWSSPRAKNLSHRIANGCYLFNLDADNFIDQDTIKYLIDAHKLNLPSHQWSGKWGDGSFGRIGVPRELFFEIGGYDEAMLPMGGQDIDLLERIRLIQKKIAKLLPPNTPALKNSIEEKVSELCSDPQQKNSRKLYDDMNRINLGKSKFNIAHAGPIISGGFASYKGLLNGKMIIMDGFGNITNI
jgi:Glycosyl transferase family 2